MVAALLCGLMLVLAGCSNGGGGGAGELSVFNVKVGDCFNDPKDISEELVEVNELPKVPCDRPHDNEAFAIFDHPGGKGAPFPGDEELGRFADRECLGRFEAYVGKPYAESTLAVGTVKPVRDSWEEDDDRGVACFLYAEDGKPLTGSKKASGT